MSKMTKEAKLQKLQTDYTKLQNEIRKIRAEASKELRAKRTKTLIEVGAMTLNLIGCGDSKISLAEWDAAKDTFVEFCKDLNETGKANELKKIYETVVAESLKNAQ